MTTTTFFWRNKKNINIFQLKKTKQKKTLSGAINIYHIYGMYAEGQVRANSVDLNEMPHSAASHQSLHYLPLIQQF